MASIISVTDKGWIYVASMDDGSQMKVSKDAGDPGYATVQAWISKGGVPDKDTATHALHDGASPTAELLHWQTTAAAIEREIGQNPGAKAALQPMLDEANTRIATLRPLT